MRRALDIAVVVVLVIDAVVLGVIEVVFLPLYVGAVPLPVGALAAALSNALAVLALGPLFRRTSIVGAPLWAWLATVLLLGTSGPGGDVVLVGDWRALLLLALGVIPAAVLLGRHMAAGAASHVKTGSAGGADSTG